MKKIITATILATAITASMSASAWWVDNNYDNYQRANGNFDNSAYNNMNGSTYGNGWGDGSSDMDADGDFEITIKARGRAKGKARGKSYANGNGTGYGTNNMKNRYKGDANVAQQSQPNYHPYYAPQAK